jgi:hypothetical protein
MTLQDGIATDAPALDLVQPDDAANLRGLPGLALTEKRRMRCD